MSAIERALSALKQAHNSPDKAREILHDWSSEKALREELLSLGIAQAISTALSVERLNAISFRAQASARQDRMIASGKAPDALTSGLYLFPLPGTGKLLGDALPTEVRVAVGQYRAQREGLETRERFLDLVLSAAKDSKSTIRKQVRAEDLANMWSRAEKESEAA